MTHSLCESLYCATLLEQTVALESPKLWQTGDLSKVQDYQKFKDDYCNKPPRWLQSVAYIGKVITFYMKVSLYEQLNTYWFQWAHGIACNSLIISNIYQDFVLWNLGKLTRGAPEKNKIPSALVLTWFRWFNFPPINMITTLSHTWCVCIWRCVCGDPGI